MSDPLVPSFLERIASSWLTPLVVLMVITLIWTFPWSRLNDMRDATSETHTIIGFSGKPSTYRETQPLIRTRDEEGNEYQTSISIEVWKNCDVGDEVPVERSGVKVRLSDGTCENYGSVGNE